MVIQTARLCHDVAFQEAATQPANTIACSRIQDHTVPAIEAVEEAKDAAPVGNIEVEKAPEPEPEPEPEVKKEESKEKPKTKSKTDLPSLRTKRHDSAMSMAQDIARQLQEGTLQVAGKSLLDAANENIKYDVELQDEQGETLGIVHMSVINGNVVVELSDLASNAMKEDIAKKKLSELFQNKKEEDMPEFMKKRFKEFVGHEEL